MCDHLGQAAVERVEKQMEQLGDIASDHRAVQVRECVSG
jgi:hypothetical protein